MKYAPRLSCLLICLPSCLMSLHALAAPVTVVTPVFSQVVAYTLPPGFKTVFESTSGPNYVRESVPVGESEKRWTQMITLTGARNGTAAGGVTPRKFAEFLGAGFQRACPSSYSGRGVGELKLAGREAYALLVSCGTAPGGDSETAIIAAIKGDKDYYTLQWAERGPASATPLELDAAKWSERLGRLAPVKLCPVVPGETQPYPSCLKSK